MNHAKFFMRLSALESERITDNTSSITGGGTGQDNVREQIPNSFFYTQYISAEAVLLLAWYCTYVMYPIIGVLGVVGNVISVIVLRKCGLEQSSNILLFCLTMADMLCLLDAFNVATLKNNLEYKRWGILTYLEALFLAIVECMVTFASQIGSRASAYVTVCIAVERLVAVFYPLHFNTLVTPRRMWLAGLSTFLLWVPWVIYINAREIHFQYINVYNRTGMTFYLPIDKQDVLYQTFRLKLFPNLTHTVPFILVTVACILISLKMATALRKRRRMASASTVQKSSVRTTRTLLLVCLVFSITHAAYIVTTIEEPNFDNRWFTVFFIFLAVRQVFPYANSSFNFFIYIAFNKKFRTVFTGLFLPNSRFTKTEHAQKSTAAIKYFKK